MDDGNCSRDFATVNWEHTRAGLSLDELADWRDGQKGDGGLLVNKFYLSLPEDVCEWKGSDL
jgi:hypothetical protein